MDDSCAVCAETLEWVAYGPCGHKEVCSTCVSRLRFICEDRKCCICKTESDIVFITKALGDYTKIIGDFSVLPSDPKEGKVGSYWYHEDVQAYFDDVDHYKMIIAMCRLSCSVCDNMEDDGGPKRKAKFKSIEQLKGHLYHQHKLFMCSLCLEGRKIFICEHKLYTRAQLNQHINSGDSEVDGSESERGGFMGHPMCDFCKRPFYGDNELYTHMSTEHFTCHICQRQHPGQYDYFKNYDDLEIHFRQQHFLCEDDACLAKKFIVFQSESEMKRHNALEHGGQMSRSKRNAALQIPTSFRYRLYEQENRRGRGRGSHSDSSQSQLAMAIQASLETANSNDTARDISSGAQSTHAHIGTGEIDNIIPPMESLGTSDSEQSLRYRQAVSLGATSGALMESAFPPLVGAPRGTQQNSLPINKGLGRNTMAARIGRKGSGSVKVLNAGPGLSGLGPSSKQSWPVANYSRLSSSSSASSSSSSPSSSSSSSSSVSSTSFPKIKPATSNPSAAHARLETTHGIPSASSSSSSWVSASKAKVGHSTSTPNLVERGRYLDSSMSDFPPVTAIRKVSPLSDFPPVTATRKDKLSTGKKTPEYVEDVQTANKSLVERMRSALEFDENKFNAFKEISGEFRQNLIGTGEYLSYVQQFGLSHLVLELARLCPDSEKQRELLETYNASVRFDNAREKSSGSSSRSRETVSTGSSKGKGKQVGKEEESLSDSILNTVRKLQANNRPTKEEVEVLSKDGYRISKGKSTIEEKPLVSTAYQDSSGGGKNQNPGGGGGGGGAGKKKKRISKFERVRLGDGVSDLDSGHGQDTTDSYSNSPSEGIQVRGAWNNGGGQKLVAMTQRGPRAR